MDDFSSTFRTTLLRLTVAFIYRRDSLRASGATLFHAAPCIFFEAEFNASAESNAEQALHAVCEVAMEGL
jgi:hypothetical protein